MALSIPSGQATGLVFRGPMVTVRAGRWQDGPDPQDKKRFYVLW